MLLVIIELNILFIGASVEENIFSMCFSARITYLEQILFLEEIAIQILRKNVSAKVSFLMTFVVFAFLFDTFWISSAIKVFADEVTNYFVDKVVLLDTYLKKMNCDLFFFLSCKTRLVEVSLDNHVIGKIPAKTDYKFIFSSWKKKCHFWVLNIILILLTNIINYHDMNEIWWGTMIGLNLKRCKMIWILILEKK